MAELVLSEEQRERLERIAEAIDNEIGEPNGVTFLRTDPSFLRTLAAKSADGQLQERPPWFSWSWIGFPSDDAGTMNPPLPDPPNSGD